MLELFTVFTKGGIALYSISPGYKQVGASTINALITNAFIEERSATDKQFIHDSFALKWTLANEVDLVFVAVYEKSLQLQYVDELLDKLKIAFVQSFKSVLQAPGKNEFKFDSIFNNIYHELVTQYQKALEQPKVMKTFAETAQSKEIQRNKLLKKNDQESNEITTLTFNPTNNSTTSPTSTSPPTSPKSDDSSFASLSASPNSGSPAMSPSSSSDNIADILKRKGVKSRNEKSSPSSRSGAVSPSSSSSSSSSSGKSTAKAKKGTVWGLNGRMDASDTPLDFSANDPKSDSSAKDAADMSIFTAGLTKESMKGDVPDLVYSGNTEGDAVEENSDEEEDGDVEEIEDEDRPQQAQQSYLSSFVKSTTKVKKGGFGSGLMSFFEGLTGNKVLTAEDLAPTLDKFKEHLVSKNVAAEIAQKLCDAVQSNLVDKKMQSFSTISSIVKQSLEESLTRILSPNRAIDIIREVKAKKARNEGPFVVVFCGVNGVGKTTNLAKICYWLIQNDLRILIAACDTFRAGAVEQLRVHTRCLNDIQLQTGKIKEGGPRSVLMFERGYGKEDATVAFEAVNLAKKEGCDIVLVDTAGRMQNNENLMKSLAKLVKTNNPDLLLFVGEALVGNEAVDQLKEFNRCLESFSDSPKPHLIDGLILTKFDTIDDKVGAAISMTYVSGQPILFVGTGQTYKDLKKLNVQAVVQALLSK